MCIYMYVHPTYTITISCLPVTSKCMREPLQLRVFRVSGVTNQCMNVSGTKWLLVRQDARTQSDRRRLGSVTLARVRVRAGYEFVSCWRHGYQRLPAGPIATEYHLGLILLNSANC